MNQYLRSKEQLPDPAMLPLRTEKECILLRASQGLLGKTDSSPELRVPATGRMEKGPEQRGFIREEAPVPVLSLGPVTVPSVKTPSFPLLTGVSLERSGAKKSGAAPRSTAQETCCQALHCPSWSLSPPVTVPPSSQLGICVPTSRRHGSALLNAGAGPGDQ